jgi:hypothetical protein
MSLCNIKASYIDVTDVGLTIDILNVETRDRRIPNEKNNSN